VYSFPITTVGALIFNPAGEVLMIRTHKWSDLWGIPGGKIKLNERAEDALRREVLEETGLEIANIRFALVQDCVQSKEFYREAHFVLLNYTCTSRGGKVILNDEAEEYQWIQPQNALDRVPLNTPTRILIEAVKGEAWT
jgi:ADP-ribose pyrophosphatase YjhB (NUDIX family)